MNSVDDTHIGRNATTHGRQDRSADSIDALLIVRRALRGRWIITLIGSSALAIGGGLFAWHAVQPLYESTGLLNIAPVLSLPGSSDESLPTALFDSYVGAQAAMLESREVLDSALEVLQSNHQEWPRDGQGIVLLQNNLRVTRKRGEQVIAVSVTHTSPLLAKAAVNAVFQSFRASTRETESVARQNILVQQQQALQSRITELEDDILVGSDRYGLLGLQRSHFAKTEELGLLESRLVQLSAVIGRIQEGTGDPKPEEIMLAGSMLHERLVLGTPSGLAHLVDREQALLAEIESMRGSFQPQHPRVRDLQRDLDILRIQMRLRSEQAAGSDGSLSTNDESEVGSRDLLLAKLQAAHDLCASTQQQVCGQVGSIGQVLLRVKGASDEVARAKENLEGVRRLLEASSSLAKSGASRLSILSEGDLPASNPNRGQASGREQRRGDRGIWVRHGDNGRGWTP
jgi:capsular polysaccharide biosynthesis protein